jgi:hypothetical protein
VGQFRLGADGAKFGALGEFGVFGVFGCWAYWHSSAWAVTVVGAVVAVGVVVAVGAVFALGAVFAVGAVVAWDGLIRAGQTGRSCHGGCRQAGRLLGLLREGVRGARQCGQAESAGDYPSGGAGVKLHDCSSRSGCLLDLNQTKRS